MISFETEQTNDLLFTENLLWDFLEEAVATANKPMHQAIIGSAKEDLAIMRTVVLRRVDKDTQKIYFHTDVRSDKINDIRSTQKLSWLFYDQTYRTQIRMSGKTIVHHMDDLAKEHWMKTAHYSRRCYLLPHAPGTRVEGFKEVEKGVKTNMKYTMEESEVGFQQFAVVETQVDWMEWYYTHHTGNRRAVFTYEGNALKDSYWIAP